MSKNKGHIKKGEHLSPSTEFKKGGHWREGKPFWDKQWLYNEYVTKGRSSADIASDFGLTDSAIIFWLKKHAIPRRSTKQARQIKKWGLYGEANGMYGRTGQLNPKWKGGISPERQALYSSQEWANAVRIVWKRDARKCQRCGVTWTRSVKVVMHIHHLVSFKNVSLRSEPSNLVLLCEDCHQWVHSKRNANKEFIKEDENA